jgi:hypothetical protein
LQNFKIATKERKEHKEASQFLSLCALCVLLRLILQSAPEFRNPNSEWSDDSLVNSLIRISAFGLLSGFGLRVSGFLPPSAIRIILLNHLRG